MSLSQTVSLLVGSMKSRYKKCLSVSGRLQRLIAATTTSRDGRSLTAVTDSLLHLCVCVCVCGRMSVCVISTPVCVCVYVWGGAGIR